jgi:hypothetical protein
MSYLAKARGRLIATRAAAAPVTSAQPPSSPPVSPTSDYEINELDEQRSAAPCPRCAAPLDASCCWTCRLRLCQCCGQAMPKPLARECDDCLTRLFAVPAPKTLDRQPWNADAARALVSALLRRVAAAADATPPAQRVHAHALLAVADRRLWAAYHAKNLPELRRAIAVYEAAAAPIFAAYRQVSGARTAPGTCMDTRAHL